MTKKEDEKKHVVIPLIDLLRSAKSGLPIRTRYEEMVSCIPGILDCWEDLSDEAKKSSRDLLGRIMDHREKLLEEFGEDEEEDVLRVDLQLKGMSDRVKLTIGTDLDEYFAKLKIRF